MTEREFNRYIEKIRPKLLCFAASFIHKGAATAEDMVQDAVVKVYNERGKEIKNIDALTITILRNVCLDYLRLRKNREEDKVALERCTEESLGFASEKTNPHSRLEIGEKMDALRQIIKKLPDDQQIAIRLRDVMGYEFCEIAQILNTSEGNVRTILSRGRKAIKGYLTLN
jgi:RNA polymerase sigma factor (sigma-70 family)